jgi:hypothetical protein
MAVLISRATGNFGTASTWALVNATAYLNSETGVTVLTTSLVASSAFAPGAVTVDGVALKIANVVKSAPHGTMTVELYNSTDAVVIGTCTINVDDLPDIVTASVNGGWAFFKFAASYLLVAGKNYTIRASTSLSTKVSLYRDGTAGNWSRALRTTTQQAPVAGDDMIVTGEYTGAGTSNSFTVTMNNTAATDFGNNAKSTVTPALAVCSKATLAYGVAAATNYLLRLSGYAIVYAGGTFTMGTSGAPIPRGSTAVLEFDCDVADGDFGLEARDGSTFRTHGLSRTSGKDIWSCLLSANAAANATSLSVDTDTGWLDNDEIGVASTSRTYTEGEQGTLNGNAGASTLTVDGFAGAGGGVQFAHGGSDHAVAEVILLTRNVEIRSVSTTLMAFMWARATAVVSMAWTRLRYMGLGTTVNATIKAAVLVQTTTGSFSMTYCSVTDGDGAGICTFGATTDNFTISKVGIYQQTLVLNSVSLYVGTTTGSSYTVEDVWTIRGRIVQFLDAGGSINRIRVAGCSLYMNLAFSEVGKTISGLVSHSNGNVGILASSLGSDCIIDGASLWRNNNSGLQFSQSASNLTILDLFAVGNVTTAIEITGSPDVLFVDAITAGEGGFTTTTGITVSSVGACRFTFQGGEIGKVCGLLIAHTNGINVLSTNAGDIILNGTSIAAATNDVVTAHPPGVGVKATKLGGVAGVNKTWNGRGIIEMDAAVYFTDPPSQKLTPSPTANGKLESGLAVAVVDSGASQTVKVWVRVSAAYNGAAPRLLRKADVTMHAAKVDAVLDTFSGAADTWVQLEGTTTALADGAFAYCVDCDGTAGAVYIDDWSIS